MVIVEHVRHTQLLLDLRDGHVLAVYDKSSDLVPNGAKHTLQIQLRNQMCANRSKTNCIFETIGMENTRDNIKEIFAKRLRALRTDRKLSRAEVSRKAGLADGVYARYERAERTPPVDTAEAIARALDTSLDYLTGKSDGALRDSKLLNRIELLTSLPQSDRDRILHTFDVLLKDALAARVAA